jgi:hypothetical protein
MPSVYTLEGKSLMSQGTIPRVEVRKSVVRRLGRRGAATLATAALLLSGVGAATATTQVTVKNPGGHM